MSIGGQIIITGEYGLPVVAPLDDVYRKPGWTIASASWHGLTFDSCRTGVRPILLD